ncbi:hypothetical protein AVEN_125055-2 [Araneus ventricosus]|uniref:Uncharacterized protein n=1 Tax=Araneus ventricosus TaxID=182803 RepID=A0A4Y2GTX4_ARAVE|nr:hypothetical protein AVEN_125055-2 [Araneus ventricosus]
MVNTRPQAKMADNVDLLTQLADVKKSMETGQQRMEQGQEMKKGQEGMKKGVAAFLSTRYFHDEESVLEIMAQTPCILPVSRHHLRTDATWIGINVRVCSISFVILHIFRATADDKLGLSNNLIYPK